jgi:hypothetical protein
MRHGYHSTAAQNKRRYYWLKARGLCVTCAGPNETKYTKCAGCSVRTSLQQEQLRAVEDSDWEPEPKRDVPRCRCGLALPCNSCLPPLEFYASSRRAADG